MDGGGGENEMIEAGFLAAQQFGAPMRAVRGQLFPMILRSPEGCTLHLMMSWLNPAEHFLFQRPDIVAAKDALVGELCVLAWDDITTCLASGVVGPKFYREAMASYAECLREGRPSFTGGSRGLFPPLALGLNMQLMR